MDTFDPALFLNSLAVFGSRLGLERMQCLAESMNHPELRYPVIHLAGTNGKGSVAAMLTAVLSAAGLKVGCYTSPHLISYNERICINGCPIAEDDFARILQQVSIHIPSCQETAGHPTQFEVLTMAAFEYFAQQTVDIAVVETGLGGIHDSTNIVMPVLSIITGISIDHIVYLGRDIVSIAEKKAGIVKTNIPVVAGEMPPEAFAVIKAKCVLTNSQLSIGDADEYSLQVAEQSLVQQRIVCGPGVFAGMELRMKMLGDYQKGNLAVALASVERLRQQGYDISDTTLKIGLERAFWPGRMHVISQNPLIIADGAHNADGAVKFVQSCKTLLNGKHTAIVFSCLQDKDIESIIKSFSELGDLLIAVGLETDRGLTAVQLRERVHNIGIDCEIAVDLQSAVERAAADDYEAVCICGSLYLVGKAIEIWHDGGGAKNVCKA